jgi:acetylornithine/N-succinyldiaminopimelate aminotransferase
MGVYNRAPVEVERGEGARLFASDGTVYLDCVQGISTNALGHAHPVLVQAVKDTGKVLISKGGADQKVCIDAGG